MQYKQDKKNTQKDEKGTRLEISDSYRALHGTTVETAAFAHPVAYVNAY